MDFDISRQGKQLLLTTARESIKSAQNSEDYKLNEIPEELDFKSGCFVTLHLRGRLRGCIGNFRDDVNILENVSLMAKQAALADPRFGPVSKDELPMCSIEISVLSPMKRVQPEEITVDRDGIYVIKGSSRGVLLPQVATEHKWDRETFLNQTCVKAGLPADSWKDSETEILSFQALVLKENNLI